MTTLTSEDWGVMRMMLRMTSPGANKKEVSGEKPADQEDNIDEESMENVAGGEEEEDSGYGSEIEEVRENRRFESSPAEKRPRRGIRFNDKELGNLKVIFKRRVARVIQWPDPNTEERSADIFVLERYNPDCGLFRSILAVPAAEWFKRMTEISERITLLFQSCSCWSETLQVKKTLFLKFPRIFPTDFFPTITMPPTITTPPFTLIKKKDKHRLPYRFENESCRTEEVHPPPLRTLLFF